MLLPKIALLPGRHTVRRGAAAPPSGGVAGSTGVPFAGKARLKHNFEILSATRTLSDRLFAPKWNPPATKSVHFACRLVTVGPKSIQSDTFSNTRSERLPEVTFKRFGTLWVAHWGPIGSPMATKWTPKSTQSR